MGRPQPSGEFHPEYEALRREYEDFRYHLPDALLEIDLASFQVLYANRMAEIVLGVTRSEIEEGLNGSALVAPGEFARMLETLQGYIGESRADGSRYTRSGTQDLHDFTLRRRDGSLFLAETQSSFVLDSNGVPVRMLTLLRDASRRRPRE